MNDINHFYGNDLSASSTGDLALLDGGDVTVQRILRRLLTNPGDYVWHPDFGAGLPGYVGSTIEADKIQALVKAHILKEDAVARLPMPTIGIQEIPGGIIVNITPLEPEWRGKVTIEISNTTPLPAKIYAGEGIAQMLFFKAEAVRFHQDVLAVGRAGADVAEGVVAVSA